MAKLLNKFEFITGKGGSILVLYEKSYLHQMSGHKIRNHGDGTFTSAPNFFSKFMFFFGQKINS